ncbi:MAG: GNAT family N-acetyltransferase [Bacteroidales bacterium]|nr:GNAT family N-acetyltransferase [Bacteroidota bacterium]MBL6949052.1 GNAT family N-acetyltransferase [Bacteroidales bacterium]
MIEIRKIESLESEDAKSAFAIRKIVFVQEQEVDPELEWDEFEAESNHYLVLKDYQPVGTARWRETTSGIKLERFAVLPEFRNQGIAGKILARVLEDVRPLGKKIYLNAQLRAVPLYERAGFVKQGETFFEADIEHYYMEL